MLRKSEAHGGGQVRLAPVVALFVLLLLAGVAKGWAQVPRLDALLSPLLAGISPRLTPGPEGLVVMHMDGRPPQGLRMPVAVLPQSLYAQGTKVLDGVPAFDWSYGCLPTAAAMLVGYYDRLDYVNMYAGPSAGTLGMPAIANGGVCPLTNAVWGANQCPLAATRQGLDGRGIRGHVDDYWVEVDSTAPDPYLTNGWSAHAWNDCTGDYMGSNQSEHGNADGATRVYLDASGGRVENYQGDEPAGIDAATGLRRFIEARGYTVLRNYNQTILGWNGNTKGFSWAAYKAQIDAGRPVILHAGDHALLGLGYQEPGQVCYVHDTWDHELHCFTWGGTYSSAQHIAVTVIELAPVVKPELFWVGGTAYSEDGVNPNQARPDSNFVFKVEYRSAAGRAPQWVRLYLFGPDGKALAGSPFKMTSDGNTNWGAGVVFLKKLALSSHGAYSYYFLTRDGYAPDVRRPGSGKQTGPIVNRAPAPTWAGNAGYTSDGVQPDTGPAGGVFTFRVKYKDQDGDAPAWVRVQVWGPDGKQITGSPFLMAKANSSTDWVSGVAYTKSLTLAMAGTYEYKFSANDGYSTTYFPAAGRPAGPVLSASGSSSLTLSGLVAQQVGEVVALTYTLSASAEVQAEVLNLAGRLIALVPAGRQEAGVQTLRWNGRNSAGSPVPAGVYLVRLEARSAEGTTAQAVCVLNVRR